MRKFLAMIVSLSLMPVVVHADVVSSDDLGRLTDDASRLQNGCQLLDFALNVQGTMTAEPQWKILNVGGVTIKYPWSPYWYLIGKQIPWFEKYNDADYHVGPFQSRIDTSYAINGVPYCLLNREYDVQVEQKTIKQYVAEPSLGGIRKDVLEYFTLKGKKAAVIRLTYERGGRFEQIVVEVPKRKNVYSVFITHFNGGATTDMIRMAASAK